MQNNYNIIENKSSFFLREIASKKSSSEDAPDLFFKIPKVILILLAFSPCNKSHAFI
jgi:hypothetical protein